MNWIKINCKFFFVDTSARLSVHYDDDVNCYGFDDVLIDVGRCTRTNFIHFCPMTSLKKTHKTANDHGRHFRSRSVINCLINVSVNGRSMCISNTDAHWLQLMTFSALLINWTALWMGAVIFSSLVRVWRSTDTTLYRTFFSEQFFFRSVLFS